MVPSDDGNQPSRQLTLKVFSENLETYFELSHIWSIEW